VPFNLLGHRQDLTATCQNETKEQSVSCEAFVVIYVYLCMIDPSHLPALSRCESPHVRLSVATSVSRPLDMCFFCVLVHLFSGPSVSFPFPIIVQA
jgi:hypothetical protein